MALEFLALKCLRDVQVAKNLNIGRSTVWAWVKAGLLPAPIKLGPRVSVWRASDIENFIQQQEMRVFDSDVAA